MTAGVPPSDLARWIREIGRGAHAARDLPVDDARALCGAMLEGSVPPLELGAILLAYRLKGETLAELTGFMTAIDARVARLDAPGEGLRPVVLPTYNGARRMPNLTPLLALLLRRYGVPVLLHGMVDDVQGSGRVTTAAILWELGIEPASSVDDAQRRLSRDAIAYAPTEVLSPSLASLLRLRERMGVRSVAHTLAKLIDPFAGRGFRRGDASRLSRANARVPRGDARQRVAHARHRGRAVRQSAPSAAAGGVRGRRGASAVRDRQHEHCAVRVAGDDRRAGDGGMDDRRPRGRGTDSRSDRQRAGVLPAWGARAAGGGSGRIASYRPT
jgi:hypothetical protein